ncbi:MAG: mannosyltransferase family protein, partial [Chloroflexota bacterium]
MGIGRRSGSWLRDRLGWAVRPTLVAVASRVFSLALLLVLGRMRHPHTWNPMALWDGWWYLEVAEKGYHAAPVHVNTALGIGYHDFAFLPGWPMTIRLAAGVGSGLGLGAPMAAAIAANLLFVLAAILIWRVLADRLGNRAADRGLALLAFAPPAFAFSMVYSEPLF